VQKDERDLLEVLRSELNFLEKDGYGHSARESWRPVFIFEDSPTCMNYDCKTNPAPCSDCVLMQLVPPEFRLGKTPCRRITLNATGETLDSLYRSGDQPEIEETLRNWLEATITQLEDRHQDSRPAGGSHSPASGETKKGIAMHENVHPKCANPACSTHFRWLLGGKFFRFRPDHASPDSSLRVSGPPNNLHGVEHFWLCDYCSHLFTLVYDAQSGVVLRLL
jgi:hypothetical protein